MSFWEEEAEPVGNNKKKLSLCGDTAQTRVLFLKHVVRHSSWWACSASGQINGWAQMFLLVKNKDAVGRLKKKRQQTKPQILGLCET